MGPIDASALTEVLDRISDGFFAFDSDWRFTYVNRAAAELIGRPASQLVGKVLWEEYPQVIGTRAEQEYRRAAAALEPREFELRGPVTGRTVEVRVYPSRDGLSVYFRDITARKQAEDALRESEARHRALFEHSLEGMALTAPDGRILDVNPAGCELLRRTRDEICAVGRAGVVDQSDPRLVELLAERQLSGTLRAELTMVRGDGTRFPAEISSAFFDAEGEVRTSLSFRDLTAQKRAVTTLQLLARTSAAVLSSLELDRILGAVAAIVVPALAEVVVIDVIAAERPIRVIACDPGAGASPVALVRSTPPVQPSARGIARVLQTGEPELVPVVTDEWLRQVPEDDAHPPVTGGRAPSSVLIVPLVARGAVVGAMSFDWLARDRRYGEADLPLARGIADLAALAIDNAQLYAEAIAARRRRDELVGIVSHDLRTPLNSIVLNARLIARRQPSQPSPEVQAINRAVARADRLVEDLVAITAIESGRLPLDRRAEPVSAILADVAELHRQLAAEGQLALGVVVGDDAGDAFVDRHRLVQALSNLVGNAIKFTAPGGRVELRARREAEQVLLEVVDTGVGIAPEQLEHIFDRFWRGRSGTGFGLGLAIAKGVIDAHGGSLEARSRVGEGTSFVIRLPAVG